MVLVSFTQYANICLTTRLLILGLYIYAIFQCTFTCMLILRKEKLMRETRCLVEL